MEWRHSGSPRPQKFRVQKSARKFLDSIFWNQDGILLIDYLPKGQTINTEYYSYLVVQLKDILKGKAREKVTKGVFSLHDNVPAHTQKKLAYQGFKYLDHPPFSPNLAPSDYHLFSGLKKTIKRSPFFVRSGGHCCRGDLVGRTTLRMFFECLEKVRTTG